MRRWRKQAPVIGLAAVFVVVRVHAWRSGVRFDASEWERFGHFVDPALLREQLGESLLYLHAQPPLPNLALGVSLRLFGEAMPLVWHAVFVAANALATACVYVLARRLGVGAWLAAAGAAFVCASPATLLYENFLFYTAPLAAVLTCTVFALERAVITGRTAAFLSLAVGLAIASWTWSLFHPAWFLAVAGYVAAWVHARPGDARRWLCVAALPCAFVFAVPVKNLVLFGEFATSTWRGMSLARVTVDRMPAAMRRAWVADGRLSALAEVGPFEPLGRYGAAIALPPPRGVALLDTPVKSNGAVNFHHAAYIDLARTFESEARSVIRRAPAVYAKSVRHNLWRATASASQYRPLAENRMRLRGYEDACASALLRDPDAPRNPLALVVILMLVGYGGISGLFAPARSPAWRATVLYLSAMVVFVVGGSALLERSENERFRFLVDSHLVVLALVAATDLLHSRRLFTRFVRLG